MLEMAVLGLLKEQDMHGYELKKRLSDVFGVSGAVSFGSLYPALGRLEAAGAVEVLPSAAAGELVGAPPDAGLVEGPVSPAFPGRRSIRRRKVYRVTPLGAQMFSELLASSQGAGEDDRTFNIRLAFARYMPPESRLGLLEHRRAVLGERLAQLAERARARRDDRYMRILAERQRDDLARDVSWLDRLIEEERTAGQTGALATGEAGAEHPAHAVQRQRAEAKRPRLVPLASASQLKKN